MRDHKCSFPNNLSIKPDGINELDACEYTVEEIYKNVTVEISKCKKCGSIDISWYRQDDTEQIEIE